MQIHEQAIQVYRHGHLNIHIQTYLCLPAQSVGFVVLNRKQERQPQALSVILSLINLYRRYLCVKIQLSVYSDAHTHTNININPQTRYTGI
jgi:hypothetical protein